MINKLLASFAIAALIASVSAAGDKKDHEHHHGKEHADQGNKENKADATADAAHTVKAPEATGAPKVEEKTAENK